MSELIRFPSLEARDLTGATRLLPDAFEADRNVVFVAFRRAQQALIDSWLPWAASDAAAAGIGVYEVPVLARHWAPFRPVIDGGMAAAIGDAATKRRTLTVYGDVRRVTGPLAITDQSTVTVLLVGRGGEVLDRASGGFEPTTAARLLAAPAAPGDPGAAVR